MKREPKFTIVIPTRNRAHLLRHALQGCLEQTWEDFQVLVSDNNSTDETAELVHQCRDERVHYVRPETTLPMPDHWEWALTHATGKYIFYLCDDDCVSKELLATVNGALIAHASEIVCFANGLYFDASYESKHMRNMATLREYRGRAVTLSSQSVLRQSFSELRYTHTPRGNNSFSSRRLIKRVQDLAGRFFLHNFAHDSSSSCMVLALEPHYIYLDEPLLLFGVTSSSIGASTQHRGEASNAYFAEMSSREIRHSPLKAKCLTNYVVDAMCDAKERLQGRLDQYEINWAEVVILCVQELAALAQQGHEVGKDIDEVKKFLKRQGVAGRLAITSRKARNWLAASSIGPLLKSIKSRFSDNWTSPQGTGVKSDIKPLILSGEKEGFSNILECARQLPEIKLRVCSNC